MPRNTLSSTARVAVSLLLATSLSAWTCTGFAQITVADLAGNWIGRGSSEEVRYRHRYGLLILTVKHNTEFSFRIDREGKIEGEGHIEYAMTSNPRGLDAMVATVSKSLDVVKDAAKLPSLPEVLKIPGKTQLQYDVPHMKYGIELRQFKFRGHVVVGGDGEPLGIRLEQYGGYRRPGRKTDDLPDLGKDDQVLTVTWEVNGVREQSTFPCWSPFLEGPGELHRRPGGMWLAQFSEHGDHRAGKSMWHEYGYVWMAKRIAPE